MPEVSSTLELTAIPVTVYHLVLPIAVIWDITPCRLVSGHQRFGKNLLHPSSMLKVNFDVLLSAHLSIFILVINQIDAQNLFDNKFISCLYMFRAPCAHHQEVKIVLYNLWYHHTCRWPSGARDGHLQVWWYQMLYNTILTSWWWAHSARNM